MRSILPRLAAAALCVLCGGGAVNALLVRPIENPRVDIDSFIALKQAQPVMHADDRWTLFAGGDVMLSRFVRSVIEREGARYPYAEIEGIARGADVAFANLENPVGTGTPIPFSGFRFRAEPETLAALKEAGFDVLSIANNHQSDNGRGGIAITIDFLRKAGFLFAGAGETEGEARAPAVLDVKGQTVAFLAYGESRFGNQVHFADERSAGIALADPVHMKEDVARARRTGADVVIVSLHAGTEYRDTPDSYQAGLLDAAADAGADIVLGHHPHVVQPLEKRGDSWIIDSLGNLVFDQMWSEAVRRGMTLLFRFDGARVTEVEAIPIQLHDFAQARIAEGAPRDRALASLAHPLKDATVISWAGAESGATVSPRAMPLQEERLPAFIVEKTLRDNLSGNRRAELYHLRDGRLVMEEDGATLWRSPADWWVQDAWTADIDGDRTRELVLSVWKSGNYGASKPFWVEENDPSVKHHVFVYGWQDDALRPLWQSSNLPRPNCEMAFADLDADGADELVALEGDYAADATCEASAVGIWKWDDWGFFEQWRSAPGAYWNMRVEDAPSGERIVVNGAAD